MKQLKGLGLIIMCALLSACSSTPPPPVVDRTIDLPRFMGDWYVIAGKFTPFERGAHNAMERYELNEDSSIATTFTFRKGDFGGPLKTFRPTGFVHDQATGAEWRMQFLWPFKSAYLILYLDDDYQHTAIGVPSRRYLWIMSRKPAVPDPAMQAILTHLKGVGYDLSDLTYIPQKWPSDEGRPIE